MRVLTEKQKQDARDRANAFRLNHPAILAERKRAYYQKHKERLLAEMKQRYEATGRARFIKKYQSNREEILKKARMDRAANPNPQRERERKWYKKNRERLRLKKKMDRINNPKKYRARDKAIYARIKDAHLPKLRAFNATPEGKLITLLRNTARRIAKLNKTLSRPKGDLLGADAHTVRAHIESQFLPGMTWENHGIHGWHIDHKKPLASFNLTDPEQIKEAAHYTNLAPLWAYDNLSKGAKIV